MMKNENNIDLSKIPKLPGVYQYFDKNGNIIYIGKSVNLKSRVSSYFNEKNKLNFAKKKMVSQIHEVKTIITSTPFESILLETNLIKKYKPKYNILMKDDKNHAYIKITQDIIPKVIKTRIKKNDGKYFGPFTHTSYVDNIIKILKKIFGHRSCNIIFEKDKNDKIKIKSSFGTKIPCLDYYIKRCSGPCLLSDNEINNYKESINNIEKFLKGETKTIINDLENKMKDFASKLNFEKAQEIKEILNSIINITQNQIVTDVGFENADIINYLYKYDSFYISKIEVRNHKITGIYNYELKDEISNKEELIEFFLEKNYINNLDKIQIIFPEKINLNNEFIKDFKIELVFPKIGEKTKLLDLAYKNRFEFAYRNHLEKLSVKTFTKKDMLELLKITGYKQINKDIIFECNDISHISGNHTVASRSVIENGKIASNKYKKFKIKTLLSGEINDFDSMREIMNRRILEIKKTGFIPDLIIIDGGKGQLSSVMEIIEKNLDEIPELNKLQIISIAKKEEEIFLPNKKESIIINKESSTLRLIQKIRDEAHRFAINFNREQRIKASKKNILEELPGFGPKTRQKLLSHYLSIDNIKNDSYLTKILSKTQIQTLKDHGII